MGQSLNGRKFPVQLFTQLTCNCEKKVILCLIFDLPEERYSNTGFLVIKTF